MKTNSYLNRLLVLGVLGSGIIYLALKFWSDNITYNTSWHGNLFILAGIAFLLFFAIKFDRETRK